MRENNNNNNNIPCQIQAVGTNQDQKITNKYKQLKGGSSRSVMVVGSVTKWLWGLPVFAPGGGGRRPPAAGRDFAPPASFFLMFILKMRSKMLFFLMRLCVSCIFDEDAVYHFVCVLLCNICRNINGLAQVLTPMLILMVCPSLKPRSSGGAEL